MVSATEIRALVWVDMEPFLKTERARCEKVAFELELVKQDLERFRTEWQPAYSRWFHGKFGEKVTRVRDLEAQVSELEHIVTNVEAEAFVTGRTERSVYARYEQMRAGAEKIDDPGADDEFPPEVEEDERRGSGHRARKKSTAKQEARPSEVTPADLRRKQIYRDLARKLHPDVNVTLTLREKELWHEVRAAYESKNLGQLETLAAMVDSGGTAGYSKIGSISRLRSIFQEFQKNLKIAQKALRQARREPSWNFTETQKQPGKLREFSRQIDHDLKGATLELEALITTYERQVKRWTTSRRGY